MLNIPGQIPLTFVLAFYMNHIVQRWWETWKLIPWPDSLALKLNTLFPNLPGKVMILKISIEWLKVIQFFEFRKMNAAR